MKSVLAFIKNKLKKIPFVLKTGQNIKRKIRKVTLCFNKENGIRRKSYGNRNPEKTFYVLRYDRNDSGFYTMFFVFMLQLEWIEKKGYIPVVDLKNYRPALLEDGHENTNLWENSFLQPSNITLDEVYKSKNVILGWKNEFFYYITDSIVDWNVLDAVNKENIDRWGRIFNKYLILSPELQKIVDDFFDKRMKPQKVLGIALRESYRYHALMNNKIVGGHPIMYPPEKSIKFAEEYMTKWGYEYIFVVAEDRECITRFSNYFKDKCIIYDRSRLNLFKGGKPVLDLNTINIEYNSNSEKIRDYLIEIELLSRCNAVVGGISAGIEAAIFRNNGKYEHMKIYDIGKY